MKLNRLIILFSILALGACSSSGIQTTSDPDPDNHQSGETSMSTPETFAKATTHLNAFSLGSDFPPDIKIPDFPGMRNTAFVVTFSPTTVLPIDLDSSPLALSTKFPAFDASAIPEAGYPNNLLILSPTQALLMGAAFGTPGIVYFNPSSGELLDVLNLGNPINLTEALPYSREGDCDFDGTKENSVGPGFFIPNLPADMAVADGKLFVTMSNGCFDSDSFYAQSLLLIFNFNDTPPFFTPAAKPYIVLSGFNATGITNLEDRLIVTSTGDTQYLSGASIPETDSFLDEIDPVALKVTNTLNLGHVAANFEPLAVTSDGARGYIGSSSFSQVYEIDLDHFEILRGSANPINVFEGPDYISDQEVAFGDQLLFISSSDHSAVRAIDLSDSEPNTLPQILDFSFPGNPGITGVAALALRPGEPSVDFQGPDLWILTNSPGSLSSATTY